MPNGIVSYIEPVRGFVKPIKFEEAIRKLKSRKVVTVNWTTKQWQEIPVAIRDRAIWSATVQQAKFVDSFQRKIDDFLKATVIRLPDGERKLKVGGRAEFVRQMMEFVKHEGIPRHGPRGAITDIGSSARLRLIFDVQTSLANERGYWQQGNDPDLLEEFPALRFIRVVDTENPRPLHEKFENEVRRKDDLKFWLRMNSTDIGGFGVPHGPWGFNSGMDTEDVDVREARRLGLVKKGEKIKSPEIAFNKHLEASVKNLSPTMRKKLAAKFNHILEIKGGKVIFREP